jgi:hypothetical protein
MPAIQWSHDATTGLCEGVEGSHFAVCLVPAICGWYSVHVTVGDRMRESFSRPIRWGTLDEMKVLVEDALTAEDVTALHQGRSSDD